MRRIHLLIALPALLAALRADAKEVKMKVKGWASAQCVCATEDALKAVGGVKSAKGDLKSNVVTIDYDDAAVKLFELEAAIKKAGYEPAGTAK